MHLRQVFDVVEMSVAKAIFFRRDNLGFIFIELMAKQNIAEVSQKVAIFLIYSTFLGERLQEKCLIWHKSPFLAQKQFKKLKID